MLELLIVLRADGERRSLAKRSQAVAYVANENRQKTRHSIPTAGRLEYID